MEDPVIELILARFGTTDKALEKQDKVLESVLREVRRTNGRVTHGELRLEALEKVNADRDAEAEGAIVTARSTRRWRIELWIGGFGVVAGSFVGVAGGAIGHTLGLW